MRKQGTKSSPELRAKWCNQKLVSELRKNVRSDYGKNKSETIWNKLCAYEPLAKLHIHKTKEPAKTKLIELIYEHNNKLIESCRKDMLPYVYYISRELGVTLKVTTEWWLENAQIINSMCAFSNIDEVIMLMTSSIYYRNILHELKKDKILDPIFRDDEASLALRRFMGEYGRKQLEGCKKRLSNAIEEIKLRLKSEPKKFSFANL